MSDIIPRASESQHWYDHNGRPVYEVPSADGKRTVTPDLRHAKKLGLVPGVTSIISCAATPQLTKWKVEQGILASLTLPRRPHEPDVEFIKRILADSQEQAQKAAEMGTAVHAAIEQHYRGEHYAPAFEPHVRGVVERLEREFGKRKWETEHAFANPAGFGSKIDLWSASPLIILDVKGKEFDEIPTKENKAKQLHWDEHAMQLAAYRYELGAPGAVCGNVFFSRNVPGLVHIHLWDNEELDRGWEQFKALLRYWQVTRRYDSSWS